MPGTHLKKVYTYLKRVTRMETNKAYNKLLEQVENLQNDLMDIEDYSEEVYQAFQRLVEELEEVTE